MRVGKNEAIYSYLLKSHPSMVEDEYFRPHDTAVISVPQKAPSNAITRHESALDLLDRVKKVSREWVGNGHKRGQNSHNVSATISIEENEWEEVRDWMWENRKYYNGLSALPYDGGSYKQAPFEDCTKEEYENLVKTLKSIDVTKIVESEDNTNLTGELACAGGACEIK
jgi:ribonucleoside-diphosphate reductase alpha chain